jgi:hypothetical protein
LFSGLSEKRLKTTFLQKVSQALNLPLLASSKEEERRSKIDLEIPKKEVAIQVILPKARVDLFCQRSKFEREWSREFLKEVTPIEKFYKEIDHLQQLLMKMKIKEVSLPSSPTLFGQKMVILPILPKRRNRCETSSILERV